MPNLKELDKLTGSLSNTSKMPCHSWGIPAQFCITGSKLAQQEDTVCSNCYALKGAYRWPTVNNAYQRRLNAYNNNPQEWAQAMVDTLAKKKSSFFRFFDSGDLQSVEMLESIVSIVSRLPDISFWLPTRESGILRDYVAKWGNNWPENLTIRLSSTRIDAKPFNSLAKTLNVKTSTVKTSEASCPSSKQEGECRDCRACWDKTVDNVSYLKH